jgi:hypothetical protein
MALGSFVTVQVAGVFCCPTSIAKNGSFLVRINPDVRGNVHLHRLPSLRLWRRLALTCDFGGSAHRVACGKRYNVRMASGSFHIV